MSILITPVKHEQLCKPAADKIASLPTQQSFHEEENCCFTLEYDDVLLKSKIKLELKKQRR